MFRCRAATFNCCLTTWLNGGLSRSSRVADAFYASIPHCDVDIICLQELIVDYGGVASRFLHHPYHTTPMESAWYTDNIRFVGSGLCILSRWPIVEQDGCVFRSPAYHAERLMAKGVLYAKIHVKDNIYVHVFNTHLQAWTNDMATDVRAQQICEIGVFMRRKLQTMEVNSEFVVFGADGNWDIYEHGVPLENALAVADLKVIVPSTPMFSFDPSRNPLGGTDDPEEYKLRMLNRDDIPEKRENNQNATPYPKQLIDFLAILKSQENKTEILGFRVVTIEARAPFLVTVSRNKQISIRTVSDHSAVLVDFYFKVTPHVDHRIVFKSTREYTDFTHNQLNVTWVLVEIVLFVLVLLILVILLFVVC